MSNKSKKHYRNTSQFKSSSSTVTAQKSDEFNPDYTDVIKDLKRIGTLAITFFVILVALSFVL
jgi:hypothetical protein